MKIGDKAKVVDKKSLLYNKTVELIKVDNEAYIFYFEPQKFKLVVHKDAMQRTVEWVSSPDRAETNFDKLLGQNGALVEERKKQVLAGALEIVQRHCEETPNKMEVVAALFGKKLNEEFEIRYKNENYIAYFRNEGLRVRGLFFLTWDSALVALLTDRAVIINDRE